MNTCIQNEKHLPLIMFERKRGRANSFTAPGCLSERTDDSVEQGNLTIAQPENLSKKTLSKRTKIYGKGIDLGNKPVLNILEPKPLQG